MNRYPLIKFTIIFITGIIITKYSSFPVYIPAILFLSVILVYFFMKQLFKSSVPESVFIFLLYLIIISASMVYSVVRKSYPAEYPLRMERIRDISFRSVITNIDLPEKDYISFYSHVDSVSLASKHLDADFTLLCKLKRKVKTTFKWSIGDTVLITGTLQKARERRNPFEFDYNEYLNSNGVAGIIYIQSQKDIVSISKAGLNFKQLVFLARLRIASLIEKLYDHDSAALLRGLLLADRSGIDYDTRENFINSGVIHVLAVSGLHVGYIAIIFLFLFSRLNIYMRSILTILGLFLFVLLTGSPASVVRATLMASMLILSGLSLRTYNNINGLALAALIILLINPEEIFNPGFLLSFSAVLSIFIFYPAIKTKIYGLKLLPKSIRSVLLFMGVSFAAQIGTLPFTLMYFNKLSIVSIFANLLVIPLIGVIVALGITSLLIGSIIFKVGLMYATVNELVSGVLFSIVDFIGKWKYAYFYISQFTLFDGIIYYCFIMALCLLIPKQSRSVGKIVTTFLLVTILIVFIKLDDQKILPENKLSVVMIDIGQGDSFLVKFPGEKIALIDAGNATAQFDNGKRVIQPLLKNLGIDRINYAFITHMDADHYKGMESLIADNIIDTLIKPETDTTRSLEKEFELLISECDVPVKNYYKHRQIIDGVPVYILNDTTYSSSGNLSTNDKSGVFKICYGETSFLFMGDAGIKIEKSLIEKYGKFLESDVLKLGHHGSKTSSCEEFMDLINPDAVLISAGKFNKFNHPSPEVINMIDERKIKKYNSISEGAVILCSDGNEIRQIRWK